MEQNSGQETPDEINRRLSFGDHDSLPETVAKATSDAEMAQEAVKQLSRQVHDQAEAIKQQNIMMAPAGSKLWDPYPVVTALQVWPPDADDRESSHVGQRAVLR